MDRTLVCSVHVGVVGSPLLDFLLEAKFHMLDICKRKMLACAMLGSFFQPPIFDQESFELTSIVTVNSMIPVLVENNFCR